MNTDTVLTIVPIFGDLDHASPSLKNAIVRNHFQSLPSYLLGKIKGNPARFTATDLWTCRNSLFSLLNFSALQSKKHHSRSARPMRPVP